MEPKPMMKIKQVQTVWTPKWKGFRPPKWFIFRWAYKIDINSTVCDYDTDEVIAECTIHQSGVTNKNGRVYPSSIFMKQVSHGNAEQVQIGVVNNFYNKEALKNAEISERSSK